MSKTIYVLSYGVQYPRIFHRKNDIKPTKAFFSLDEAKNAIKNLKSIRLLIKMQMS